MKYLEQWLACAVDMQESLGLALIITIIAIRLLNDWTETS